MQQNAFTHSSVTLTSRRKLELYAGVALVSAATWVLTVEQTNDMETMMARFAEPVGFVVLWTTMMTAMMLPSIYPTILLFEACSQSRAQFGKKLAPPWFFAVGYLVAWTGFGIIAYLGEMLLTRTLHSSLFNGGWKPTVAGFVFIVTGIYQFTQWKKSCLRHCRSPIHFLMDVWQDGVAGACWMGIQHGFYCVVCCFGLMILLFLLGLMSPLWMAAIGFIVFLEKVSPYGSTISNVVGVMIILTGIALIGGLVPWWGTMM